MLQVYFAFVRNLRTSGGGNLKNFAQIQSAAAHARREDLTSQGRQDEGRSHKANYFWSKAGEGLEGGGADYVAAYKAHKAEFGIKTERKGAAIGIHLLVGVSPEWLAEAGDPRDLGNERVQQLIAQTKIWAESWMGEGAVWAVRYDTDEKGSGIVDILASPIRAQKHKSGSSKPSISVAKANAELAQKHGVLKGWEAMQTDWALHAQATLDQKLQRGTPKSETRRVHLFPEEFKEALAAVKDFAEFKEEAAEMARDLILQKREADAAKEAAQQAERHATKIREEEEDRTAKAKQKAADAAAAAQRADEERVAAQSAAQKAREEERKAQEAVAQLEPQRAALEALNAEIEEKRGLLADLKEQAGEIIEKAQKLAREIIAKATEQTRTVVEAIENQYANFKRASTTEKQLINKEAGLREAVTETLTDLGIAGQTPDLGEVDEKGDPVSVLQLIFRRADRRAADKNKRINIPNNNPRLG